MDKRGSLWRGFFFLLVAFLVVFIGASFLAYDRSGLTGAAVISEDIEVTNTNSITVPGSTQPLPNTDEGALSIWTKPPIEMFGQFSDARDYIVFFTATNVPGLRLVYNLKDKVFEAGTPIIRSQQIDIFDNQAHNVVYTFKRGHGQLLFVDGVQVNASEFMEISVNRMTGFSVFEEGGLEEVDIKGVEVVMYDRYVTQDDLGLIR